MQSLRQQLGHFAQCGCGSIGVERAPLQTKKPSPPEGLLVRCSPGPQPCSDVFMWHCAPRLYVSQTTADAFHILVRQNKRVLESFSGNLFFRATRLGSNLMEPLPQLVRYP
jgi:hypothetical protein